MRLSGHLVCSRSHTTQHAIVCQLAKIVHRVQFSSSLNRRVDKGRSLKSTNMGLTKRKSGGRIVRKGTLYVRIGNTRKRLEVKSAGDRLSLLFQSNPENKSSNRAQRPGVSVFFEPFSFLAAGCSGNHGKSQFLPLPLLVPCGAMAVIGVSTLPQER